MLKPTCPLLAHPCIENRCAWWSSQHAACATVGMFNQIAAAKSDNSEITPLKEKRVKKA